MNKLIDHSVEQYIKNSIQKQLYANIMCANTIVIIDIIDPIKLVINDIIDLLNARYGTVIELTDNNIRLIVHGKEK